MGNKKNYGPKTKTPRKKAPQKTQLLRMGPRPKPQRRKNHQTLQLKKSQRIRSLQQNHSRSPYHCQQTKRFRSLRSLPNKSYRSIIRQMLPHWIFTKNYRFRSSFINFSFENLSAKITSGYGQKSNGSVDFYGYAVGERGSCETWS